MTLEEVAKMSRKNVSIEQFLKLSKRIAPNVKVDPEKIFELGNGAFLGIHRNEKGKFYRLHLQTIWIKKFKKSYSCHKNIKQGKEILISNFKLPDGPVEI